MKLNIGLFNDSFPPQMDGVANATQNYAKVINEHFGKSIVVTPKYPGYIDKFPFEVYRYRSIPPDKRIGYRAGNPFSIKMIENLKDRELDLIHMHSPFMSAVLARLLTQKDKVPIVATYHTKYDIDIQTRLMGKIPKKIAVDFVVSNMNIADEVWAVSNGAGLNLQSLGYKGNFRVMENGVDFEKGTADPILCHRLKNSFDIPSDVPIFLFVGRMVWYKNIRLILDTLKICADRGVDFRMIFVGDGFDLNAIIKETAQLGLEDKVFFPGRVTDREDLRVYYSIADLFLFPSTYDTNGLVVREAAACNCPSVLVEGSCAAEGIEDRVSGYLTQEDNEACAQTILSAINNKEEMKKIGENASRDIYISWFDAVKKAYIRYEELVEAWPYPLPYQQNL